jgi:hypothetical protein
MEWVVARTPFLSNYILRCADNASERETKRIVLNRKNSLFVGNEREGDRRSGRGGSDSFQPDQHVQATRDRSAAIPNAIAGEHAGHSDQSIIRLAAGPLAAAKLDTDKVHAYVERTMSCTGQ